MSSGGGINEALGAELGEGSADELAGAGESADVHLNWLGEALV